MRLPFILGELSPTVLGISGLRIPPHTSTPDEATQVLNLLSPRHGLHRHRADNPQPS